MVQQETIRMSSKELSRYDIISKLLNGIIKGTTAAALLQVSIRHIRRLKARVSKFGAQGLVHGSRGKPSNRRVTEAYTQRIEQLMRGKYHDFGPLFASEKLHEIHHIKISKEKLRQLMIEWNLWQPKPRKQNKEYRTWRPRKEHYGEMQQFDGSYHRWFEDRGEGCCLLASIDDATGKITHGQFVSHEGVQAAFTFWKDYIETHGKPLSIYLDRHSTYKQNHKSVFGDPHVLTQFERAMGDLEIRVIHAYSPQAKGRIERLFGTLQDRLIKELRLTNISTIKEANQFLQEVFIPRFNKRFSVVAVKRQSLHRSFSTIDKENIDKIFSEQTIRIVNNDFTIQFKNHWFQLSETQPTLVLRKDKVLIEERLNGEIHISLRNKYLSYTVLPKRPEKLIKMHITGLTREKPTWKPPPDHQWRRPFVFSHKPTDIEHHKAITV